jgi:hypothetical protein
MSVWPTTRHYGLDPTLLKEHLEAEPADDTRKEENRSRRASYWE